MITAINLYFVLILVLIIQRLLEVRKAEKNAVQLLSRGAYEAGSEHYPWMVVMHTGWFIFCALEAILAQTPPSAMFVVCGIVLMLVGQVLRMIAIRALGERWTTRIIVLPGEKPISQGIFTKIKHPNYVGVVLEIAALPLIFESWYTLVVFSALNAWLLSVRIPMEELALAEAASMEVEE